MIDRITEIVRLYEMNECNPTWCPPEARIFPTDDSKCRECIAERIHRAYLADGWVRKAANQRVPQPIVHCVCGGQAHIIGGYPHSNRFSYRLLCCPTCMKYWRETEER